MKLSYWYLEQDARFLLFPGGWTSQDQSWPGFGQLDSGVDHTRLGPPQHRPGTGQLGSEAELNWARSWPDLARTPPTSSRGSMESANFAPEPTNIGPASTNSGPDSVKCGSNRIWPSSDQIRPELSRVRPKLAQDRPNLARQRSALARCRPNFARHWPRPGSSTFAPGSNKLGPETWKRQTLARNRSIVVRVYFGPKLVNFALNSADFDQKWLARHSSTLARNRPKLPQH